MNDSMLNTPTASAAPPEREEPKMAKFWKLAGEGYDIATNFDSLADAVANGKIAQAQSPDNKPVFVLESVKMLQRPLPDVQEIDL